MPRKLALTLAALVAGLALALVFALARPAAQTSADPNLDTEEQAFVTLINNYRQANGLGPLAIDWEMQSSSDWMSSDMGVNAYFSHTDSLGRDPWTRMCAFGYCYNTWMGENIAAGYTTASDVFTAWKNSPGHNANMLGSNYVAMGISRAYVVGSPYGWYWTNDFGGVQSNAAAPAGGGSRSTPAPTPTATPACPGGIVPPWLIPSGDLDCDGFASSLETLIGTDPTRACGANTWPPDINNDQTVNTSDVLRYHAVFNTTQGGLPGLGGGSYAVRYDLNGDGKIDTSDILQFRPFFNKSCSP